MEEVLAQFKGVVWVSVYSRNSGEPELLEKKKYILQNEHDNAILAQMIKKVKAFNIMLHKKKDVEIKKKSLFNEKAYDFCVISGDNYLLMENISEFSVTHLDSHAVVLIYPHGLERMYDHRSQYYNEYYYLVPVIGLLIFLYLVERELKVRGKQNARQ